jgi:two-component system, response regulator PdtaR
MVSSAPSILITDDDAGFRETVRGMLEPQGFRTLTARSGNETLQILSSPAAVDLLLLDMHMPLLTGLETIRRIRQFNAVLPCVLLSAALDETIRNQARLVNVFSVLSKPVTRNELTTTIHDALARIYGWPKSDQPSAGG